MSLLCRALLLLSLFALPSGVSLKAAEFRLAVFSADVTIPLGHRCMGVLPTKSVRVLDPLEAHGIVLLSESAPVVFVAVDWCEIRNGAYEQWRAALAEAVGTSPERVLVTALHQHDAPVVDADAAALLAEVGLPNELYDTEFHARVLLRIAQAARESLAQAVPITHLGMGQARVERIASNRRVVLEDGRVTFDRGSRSAGNPLLRDAPEGEIDPWLKLLSFWNGDQPVAAISHYATHPMSTYGQGEISADFVGLARRGFQAEHPELKHIFAPGCGGDVTAGKYNDGSPQARAELIQRLQTAMSAAWQRTERVPLQTANFRVTPLELEFYDHPQLSEKSLQGQLNNSEERVEERILAAMGLASRRRVAAGKSIDLCCLDLGPAKLVLLPGEAFVRYQLLAQELAPDAFVIAVGYGESWTGYIPTNAAFADGFHDKWLWVAPGSENRLTQALQRVLQ
jgi:hypothetical protein